MKATKIILNTTFIAMVIGTILEFITCYRLGTPVDFGPMAIIYSTLACSYAILESEEKKKKEA